MYQAITSQSEEAVLAEFEGAGYGKIKKRVAEAVIETLEPIQTRYHQMAEDPGYIEQVLKEGAERVRPIAENRLRAVQKEMGLRK
jgi:tryptophanyl-tRNA synthetase